MNKRDVITTMVYSVPEEYTMREVADAYRDLFNGSEASKIVSQDLVQFVGMGSESFNPDINVQNFTTGMKMLVQHMVNSINRELYIDEMTEEEEEG